ncbi:hepcidin-like [Chanos chanos]|uniref:Hepcidin-like n=1 Tax=Chanos chanos TaxID=29144 RepID=A0A6J2W4J1_CHACN|nr:hepcidin-like [Chanos chanos]
MKYISVCVAATVIIACLCILETSALPLAEVDEPSNNEVLPEMELTETSQEQPSVDEPSNNEALPEMELTETSQGLPSYFRVNQSRRCRICCSCCPGMRGCGTCCRW